MKRKRVGESEGRWSGEGEMIKKLMINVHSNLTMCEWEDLSGVSEWHGSFSR
jgi:hypothetical protein